ncbi:hypothetical protein DVF25_02335 [Salmonella enterica subsp. enterica serovar Virchow]|nr:hypothetical protein [Salmonella enterica]EBY2703090.1 hypothetical protein [Salmonella enterica subsp. enterica serovar Virchow]ECS5605924.1 hypothetical protein [Salmonella enterica subsp. enterica serovar Virchow]
MLGNKKGLLEQIHSFSVFPAPAGINRLANYFLDTRYRVPRASGDKPGNWAIIWALFMCSPRQRG